MPQHDYKLLSKSIIKSKTATGNPAKQRIFIYMNIETKETFIDIIKLYLFNNNDISTFSNPHEIVKSFKDYHLIQETTGFKTSTFMHIGDLIHTIINKKDEILNNKQILFHKANLITE